MKLYGWSLTDIGRKRDHNEDSHLLDEGLRLFAVADGMGGHQGGDQASKMAVEVLRDELSSSLGDLDETAKRILQEDPLAAVFPREPATAFASPPVAAPASLVKKYTGTAPIDDDLAEEDTADMPTDPAISVVPPPAATVLRAAARVAGRAIFDAAQADPRLSGMGTTLTAIMFHKDRAHLVHVGDSRCFLFRDSKIVQVTEDHSWIAEQVKAGVLSEAEARESKFRHIITRSVGFEREVDVDLLGVPVLPGDCFLLCSDGMSNYVDTEELSRILATTYYSKVPQLLVDLANDRGGDDNITVVLVYAANEKS
jgi:serine/threonine protein phosphatase PrpC